MSIKLLVTLNLYARTIGYDLSQPVCSAAYRVVPKVALKPILIQG